MLSLPKLLPKCSRCDFLAFFVFSPFSDRALNLRKFGFETHIASALDTPAIAELWALMTYTHALLLHFFRNRNRVFDHTLRRIPQGPKEGSFTTLLFRHEFER